MGKQKDVLIDLEETLEQQENSLKTLNEALDEIQKFLTGEDKND